MKTFHVSRIRVAMAMTLIELLVVISIIGILAGLLLPALAKAKTQAKVAAARHDIEGIKNAVIQYRAEYSGRYPIWGQANVDATFGVPGVESGIGVGLSNKEVLSILMATTNFANLALSYNTNNQWNPRLVPFLTAKVRDATDVQGNGVGGDGVFRDPWQNPYIVTLDLNLDGFCQDSLYSLKVVSQNTSIGPNTPIGYNGLFDPNGAPGNGPYLLKAEVMVWSFGPDGKIDNTVSAISGFNKDNVLSWTK